MEDKQILTELTILGYKWFSITRLYRTGGCVLIYTDNGRRAVKVDKFDADPYGSLYIDITDKDKIKRYFCVVYWQNVS